MALKGKNPLTAQSNYRACDDFGPAAIFPSPLIPMKALLSLVILCVFLSERSAAIPQNFGNNGFLNAVGIPFEQFAAARNTWAKGAELKGRWQARGKQAA